MVSSLVGPFGGRLLVQVVRNWPCLVTMGFSDWSLSSQSRDSDGITLQVTGLGWNHTVFQDELRAVDQQHSGNFSESCSLQQVATSQVAVCPSRARELAPHRNLDDAMSKMKKWQKIMAVPADASSGTRTRVESILRSRHIDWEASIIPLDQ